jgi:hypothetical protein
MKEQTKCYCGHTTTCDCGPEEPKQETLEEFAERLCPNKQVEYDMIIEGANWQKSQYTIEEQHIERSIGELEKEYIKGFNEGSAWQQERSYSEIEDFINEVKDKIDLFEYTVNQKSYISEYLDEWFERFKKK